MIVIVDPKTVTAVLAAAATTTQPSLVASYADVTDVSIVEGGNELACNGTTPVVIVASPGVGPRRVVKNIYFTNLDTVSHTVTILQNSVVVCKQTVIPGGTIDLLDTKLNFLGGTGTASRITKWANPTTLTDSQMVDNVTGGVLTWSGTFSGSRAVTVPDASFTVAGLQVAQTFTTAQSIALVGSNNLSLSSSSATNNGGQLFLFNDRNSTAYSLQFVMTGSAASAYGPLIADSSAFYSIRRVSLCVDSATESLYFATGSGLTKTCILSPTGRFTVNSTEDSTSNTTGAVVIPNGGLGVGGAINAGGAINTIGATNQVFEAKTSSAGNFSVLRLTNTGASGRTYDFDCCGNTTPYPGAVILYDGTASTLRYSMGPTGGFYIGNTYTDPGQGNLTVQNAIRSVSPTAGIGYGTGAGGTVTQLTSKSTGVTLNAVSGTITMNAASLSSNSAVNFTLTNSTIAATDVVVVCIKSGGTIGQYHTSVDAVAAGSCSIQLHNDTPGSLAEAVVLSFVVIKAVNS